MGPVSAFLVPLVYGLAAVLFLPAVYALAALACLLAQRAAARRRDPAASRFWGALVGLMLALAALKLPLVPSDWGAAARLWAVERGWYAGRRPLQAGALALLGLMGLVGTVVLVRRVARLHLPLMPILGAAVLIGHTIVRLSSFHHSDAILNQAVGGLRLATAVQAVGLMLVAIPATRATLTKQS